MPYYPDGVNGGGVGVSGGSGGGDFGSGMSVILN